MKQPAGQVVDRLRVSRDEREATVAVLQESYADERLEDDEFDARVRQALTATTRSDLDKLVEDLPAAPPRQERGHRRRRRVRLASAVVLAVGVVVTGAGALGVFSAPAPVEAQDSCLSTGQLVGPDVSCPDATTQQLQIFRDAASAGQAAEQLQELAAQHPDVRLDGLATHATVSAERANDASLDSQQLVLAADGDPSAKAMGALAKTSAAAADAAQGAVDEALDRIDRQ